MTICCLMYQLKQTINDKSWKSPRGSSRGRTVSHCVLVYNVFIFTDKRGFQVHYAEKVSWKSCREDAVKLIRRANIWVM